MGIVLFKYRNVPEKYICSDQIWDLGEDGGKLTSMQIGDCIILNLNIAENIFQNIKNHPIDGVFTDGNPFYAAENNEKYSVEINFKIVGRQHYVSRDWMSAIGAGFRLSSTTIILEATSDAAEAIIAPILVKQNEEIITKVQKPMET